jgi:hypothetical protein
MIVLREVDTNFDGKIDKRRLTEWTLLKYGPGIPEIPGYKNLWREEDTDFDGNVDIYTEKGQKTPSDKIGKPMDPSLTPIPGEENPEDGGILGAQRLVDDRNERYGLNK